ncbi:hypothetical protein S7335_127 [Synechococcus sp. PCC 7335]|nr:hypothetical protein S7335_127 [Synechococcus sp. PCC 7335]
MLFGWERVNPYVHLFSTVMVAFGANLSTFWILIANSWMQTPAGGEFIDGKFIVRDYFQAMFSPFMRTSVLHMFFATLETSLFVIGGISAWYVLIGRRCLMATGVKPLSGGIQNSLLKRLERLINEFPGFPTLFFGLFANSVV